jgi:hypothetical protein
MKLLVCLRNFNGIVDLHLEGLYIVPVDMGSGGMTFTLSSMTIKAFSKFTVITVTIRKSVMLVL